jgi:hypothetical protein
MKAFLETIAQQIDRIAAKPFEAVAIIVGLYTFWLWLGWWGMSFFIVFVLLVTALVDVVTYLLCNKQTYARYGDTTVWMSGFHPFQARVAARTCDQAIKKHGERAFIDELHKLAREHGSEITVTATDTEGNATTSSTRPLDV